MLTSRRLCAAARRGAFSTHASAAATFSTHASAAAAAAAAATAAAATPKLFTPGPLTTSPTVKAAMQVDLGSRDARFLAVVAEIRSQLLALGGAARPAYECVLTAGSGTFGVESVLGSALPRSGGRLLVCANGAYGERMLAMAAALGLPLAPPVRCHERGALSAAAVVAAAAADPSISHVAVVHHETTSGVLNPVHAIGVGLAALPHAPRFIVDSMSAFGAWTGGARVAPPPPPSSPCSHAHASPPPPAGAYPVSLPASHIPFLVSSSNKCIEGVPGFSFALCEAGALKACAGNARSLSLDLHAQWAGLAANGQFRFTPPTHALLAFRAALREHAAEGGAAGRLARYAANHAALLRGMAGLGFHPYVAPDCAGCIITTFLVPTHASFNFAATYAGLAARGYVIYPGKTTAADSFRIGSIGQLHEADMVGVVAALREVLLEQGVPVPVTQAQA
jgi:2-aminoethylphosphonate-pyruvate transaminase